MSICYNLIEGILGGHISIQSQQGKGTIIHIEMPLVAPALGFS